MSVTQDWSDALSHLTPGFLDFNFFSCEDAEVRVQEFYHSSPPSHYVVIRHIHRRSLRNLMSVTQQAHAMTTSRTLNSQFYTLSCLHLPTTMHSPSLELYLL